MARLRFTRAASDDLSAIRAYIARDNPAVAKTFIESLIVHCGQLTATPFMGPLRPDLAPAVRAIFVRRHYAVLYRVTATADIQVIRVIHAARDIRRVLKVDE